MVELTLLRLDVDVESVTAKANAYAPFARSTGGEDADEEGTDGPTVEVERSGGGRRRVKVGLAAALVGLAFLVVGAFLLRRYVTEGDEEMGAETEPVAIE